MANDTCANAVTVTSFPIVWDARDNAADISTSPSCAGNPLQQNGAAWFLWVADRTGTVVFITYGSACGDTLLSIWSGTCGALVEVGCGEDNGGTGGLQSRISVSVTSGTTYYLKVSATSPTAAFQYQISRINETCAAAMPITSFPLWYDARQNADDTTNTPSCAANAAEQNGAAWFTWVSDRTATVVFTTYGSLCANTLLSIWTGTCGALVQVGCGENNGGSGLLQSRVSLAVTSGTTYYFKVSATNPANNYQYYLNLVPYSGSYSTCATALSLVSADFPALIDATSALDDTVNCPSCANDCAQQNRVVWVSWVSDVDGPVGFNTLGSLPEAVDTNHLLSVWSGTCGAGLVQVACGAEFGAGAFATFTAVLGTTYYIKVSYLIGSRRPIYKLNYAKSEFDAFVTGDFIIGNTFPAQYGSNGTLKAVVPMATGDEFPDIGAQDSTGNVYIPIETSNLIRKYLSDGAFSLSFTSNVETPHCLSFDAVDTLYVGYVGTGPDVRDACGDAEGGASPPTSGYHIRKFVDEVLAFTYTVSIENGGTAHIDLARDQRTMLYTSLGRTVFAFDVVTGLQLPNFATLPAATAGEMLRGIRILPDGSVLVVDAINVKRLNAAGAVIQTYNLLNQSGVNPTRNQHDLGVLSLNADGTIFYVANRADGPYAVPAIMAVNVLTGALVSTFTDKIPHTQGAMCSGGMMVYNGFRAATTPFVGGGGGTPGRYTRRWLRRSPVVSG